LVTAGHDSSVQEFTSETGIVVDELALVRAGIVAELARKGIEIVAQTRSGREAASLAATEHADVVVVAAPADLPLADTVRRLVAVRPQPAVVALVAPGHEHETRYLLAMGARGIGSRTSEPEELGLLVDAALKGVQYVAPALHAALSGALKPPPLAAREDTLLTSREREVLVLLAEGRTNREIASALSVTLATVKSHLVHLYSKLEASNRNQALGRAVSLGLLG
jgi:DNA-binding NarL/FixJ family response regulator